jgi:hypothetical protein
MGRLTAAVAPLCALVQQVAGPLGCAAMQLVERAEME